MVDDSSQDADRVAAADVPSYEDVRSAWSTIRSAAHMTPVVTSRSISELVKAEVFFKAENLQRSGSFKFRGAYNAASRLAAQGQTGVCTISSGNFAQALALAGAECGLDVNILMPEDGPQVKREATIAYGATVELYDRYSEPQHVAGARFAEKLGLPLVSPYDDRYVIAGAGTAALELFDSVGDLDFLLCPVGGGGLLAGTLLATAKLCPTCRVIGVEPMDQRVWSRSLRAGERLTSAVPRTLADGQQLTTPGAIPFEIAMRYVPAVMGAEEGTIVDALELLLDRSKLVVEPSGAMGLAALLTKPDLVAGGRVGIILSGGNLGLRRLSEIVRRHDP